MADNSLDWVVLKRLIGLVKPYRWVFILSAGLAIILAPIGILRPYLINRMVDDHIAAYAMDGIKTLIILYMVVLLVNVLCRYLFIFYTNVLGQSIIRDLRDRVFRHLNSLKLSYFDKTPIGTSTTRTISDIESVNTVFTQGAITMIADILGIIAVLIIMFVTSWRLSLICLTTVPVLIMATYVFKEKIKSAYQSVRTEISKMNAFLQERITGMRVIQIFNAEKQEMKKFDTINQRYTDANLRSIVAYAIFFPVVELISAISLALMVWWGARGVLTDDVTLGALIVFPLYLSMLFRPIRMLADKFNTLQMGMVAAERIFNVLDRDTLIQDHGTLETNALEGHVRFDQVGFAYDQVNYVLKDVSFELMPGETMAIVGSTGSGKTTIINVLNRFYEIQNGKIEVDGKSISDYKLESLRNRIAIVLQDVFLFTGTVFENIRLRDENISMEQVIEASKMIGAHPFIEALPGAYEFQITERGNNLSMGQRQLISFVRALVFDPDILILDEATSSIDTETEAVIQYAIEKLIVKRTSIIIAHRLSTIRHAHKILVLDKGMVAEYGPHEELVQIEDGAYRKLYEIQFEDAKG